MAIALGMLVGVVLVGTPVWLPVLGTGLVVDDPVEPADVALVLEGTGKDATDTAESWRQQGLVHDVVIVEAPVKTHALVAYWSDFVRWGLASPAPTPVEHLTVVRAASTQAAQQARAALPALQAYNARLALVPGGGSIGSRLWKGQLASVLEPRGIGVRLISLGNFGHFPGRWYQNAPDRRAVLDSWLQVLVPYLSGYEPDAGS